MRTDQDMIDDVIEGRGAMAEEPFDAGIRQTRFSINRMASLAGLAAMAMTPFGSFGTRRQSAGFGDAYRQVMDAPTRTDKFKQPKKPWPNCRGKKKRWLARHPATA